MIKGYLLMIGMVTDSSVRCPEALVDFEGFEILNFVLGGVMKIFFKMFFYLLLFFFIISFSFFFSFFCGGHH